MADDEMTYDALVDLKRSIDRQNELQEETNGLLRALVDALASNSQELLELRESNEAARKSR